MDAILYLILLVNLAGIILIVILIESHNRIHTRLKRIETVLNSQKKYRVLDSGAHYWMVWHVLTETLVAQQSFVKHEQYENAEKLKSAIDAMHTLLEEYLDNSEKLANDDRQD